VDLLEHLDTVEKTRQIYLGMARDAYQRGHDAGFRAGYEAAGRDLDALWAKVAAPVVIRRPDQAELELRRWGPGGRARFSEPRPGDYPGLGADEMTFRALRGTPHDDLIVRPRLRSV